MTAFRPEGGAGADQRYGDLLYAPSEILDETLRITSPHWWAALAGLASVLAGFAVWAFLGNVASSVQLTGLLVHGTGPVAARPSSAGVLSSLAVRSGQRVTAGQRVAVILTAHGRANVTSPVDGVVMPTSITAGTQVQAGSPIISVDPVSQPLRAVLLIPLADGLPVQAGFPVQLRLVSASSVIDAHGTISSLNEYPVDQASLSAQFAGLPSGTVTGGPWRLAEADLSSIGITGSGQHDVRSLGAAIPSYIQVFADAVQRSQRPVDVLIGRF